MVDKASLPAQIVQQTHRRLQLLVREVAVLCRRSLADEVFYPAYLDRIAESLSASRAAIWIVDARGKLACRWQSQSQLNGAETPVSVASRRRRAERVMQTGESAAYRAGVYAPLRQGAKMIGVIEVNKGPTRDVSAARRWLRFVQHVAMLATERPLPSIAQVARESTPRTPRSQLLDVAKAIHQSLDIDETSYAIVNELRGFLACDRVSLVLLNRGGAQTLAISGQATLNRRAGAVREIERLAANCVGSMEAKWLDREPTASQAFCFEKSGNDNEARVRNKLGIVPLPMSRANDRVAVLVVECLWLDHPTVKFRSV